MTIKPSIVWFRQDLRIEDHPALHAAVQKGGPIIPVYIWAPEEEGEWAPGGASRWWIHHSLENLASELKSIGLALVIRQHSTLSALLDLVKITGADTIYWNRRYEPHIIQRDAFIKAELQNHGIKTGSFNGNLLNEPWMIANKQNRPFQVFSPFWKTCLQQGEPALPLGKPKSVKAYRHPIESDALPALNLLPRIHWDTGIAATWTPGAKGARLQLQQALKHVIAHYTETRDRPDIEGTSRMSPYLHHGEITPRMIWHAIRTYFPEGSPEADAYLRQIGWREFGYHLLYHFPQTPTEPLKIQFTSFPWKNHYHPALRAWQKGETGFPLVDAGMRQMWATGWMHNRVRMIVASFLVKDLLIPWQEGSKWFWDTLVDADLANNTLGWQWVAGCGADAVPYFRIFNPITQGEKFDLTGDYVKQWIPELSALPQKWLYRPWEAPVEVLKEANIKLGATYPKPIVDHAQAREKALEAYAKL